MIPKCQFLRRAWHPSCMPLRHLSPNAPQRVLMGISHSAPSHPIPSLIVPQPASTQKCQLSSRALRPETWLCSISALPSESTQYPNISHSLLGLNPCHMPVISCLDQCRCLHPGLPAPTLTPHCGPPTMARRACKHLSQGTSSLCPEPSMAPTSFREVQLFTIAHKALSPHCPHRFSLTGLLVTMKTQWAWS